MAVQLDGLDSLESYILVLDLLRLALLKKIDCLNEIT